MKGIRPEIIHFARLMEQQMKANDDKGGWHELHPADAIQRFFEEAGELVVAILEKDGIDRIASEAADCANFLMMLVLVSKRKAAR